MIFILFIIALFSFVSGQLFRIPFGNGLVIQLTDVAVSLAVSAWLIRELWYKRLFRHFYHPYTKRIGAFVIVGLLSLGVNTTWLSGANLFVSSLYLLRWVVYALVFYEVKSFSKKERRIIIRVFVIVSIMLILIGYLQYIFYPNLRNLYYLGWDDHLFRMFSTLLDPNFAGMIFSLFLILILSYLFSVEQSWSKKSLCAASLFVLSFVALLLTYSRSGYLAFAGGSISLFSLLRKRIYLFILLAILSVGIFSIPKDLHSAGVELWRTASISARIESAKQAFTIFVDHPIIGVGFDTYRYSQKEYAFAEERNWEMSHSGGGTDSSLLFILVTTGIIGLMAYGYLWYTILRRNYKTYTSYKTYTFPKIIALCTLASIGALFVNSFFINSLFYPFILFWVWTMVGLIE